MMIVGNPTIPHIHGDIMKTIIQQYDAKVDSKKRITIRNATFDYYHVEMYEDGRIMLEPRELTAPITLSKKTLNMMDKSVENMKKKKVSDSVDLSEFEK